MCIKCVTSTYQNANKTLFSYIGLFSVSQISSSVLLTHSAFTPVDPCDYHVQPSRLCRLRSTKALTLNSQESALVIAWLSALSLGLLGPCTVLRHVPPFPFPVLCLPVSDHVTIEYTHGFAPSWRQLCSWKVWSQPESAHTHEVTHTSELLWVLFSWHHLSKCLNFALAQNELLATIVDKWSTLCTCACTEEQPYCAEFHLFHLCQGSESVSSFTLTLVTKVGFGGQRCYGMVSTIWC